MGAIKIHSMAIKPDYRQTKPYQINRSPSQAIGQEKPPKPLRKKPRKPPKNPKNWKLQTVDDNVDIAALWLLALSQGYWSGGNWNRG